MATKFTFDKWLRISWIMTVDVPAYGPSVVLTVSDWHAVYERILTIEALLKTWLGVDLTWGWEGEPGRKYKDTDPEKHHVYIHTVCKEGGGLLLSNDTQITIGDYTDYLCLGYRWKFAEEGKRGIRVVGRDTIYTDYWITGDRFYMTNNPIEDSMDLSPIRRDTLVEFISV